MPMESDKVMFEIYREASYNRKFQVIYFTELNEHNKEYEINRALSGEHFYDGFIRNFRKDDAKRIIENLLRRMNAGEDVSAEEFDEALREYAPA